MPGPVAFRGRPRGRFFFLPNWAYSGGRVISPRKIRTPTICEQTFSRVQVSHGHQYPPNVASVKYAGFAAARSPGICLTMRSLLKWSRTSPKLPQSALSPLRTGCRARLRNASHSRSAPPGFLKTAGRSFLSTTRKFQERSHKSPPPSPSSALAESPRHRFACAVATPAREASLSCTLRRAAQSRRPSVPTKGRGRPHPLRSRPRPRHLPRGCALWVAAFWVRFLHTGRRQYT